MKVTIKNKKTKVITLIVILVIGSFLAIVWIGYRNSHTDTVNDRNNSSGRVDTAETVDEANRNNKAKAEFLNQQKNSTGDSGSTYKPALSELSVAAQTIKNDTVVVRVSVAGATTGSCNLTISNNSKILNETVDIIFQPQASTCAGFDIPISSLGNGNWLISVEIKSGGSEISKSISHQVGT